MLYFIIFISLINIVLWIVFLIRFKKLFSTDAIIEKTRYQLNNLMKDIDNATDRDIQLAEETSKRLQNAVKEAEMKMNLFAEASERLRGMIAEADKINKLSNHNNSLFQDFNKISTTKPVTSRNVNSYLKNSGKKEKKTVDPEAVYEVSIEKQPELFDSVEDNVTLNIKNPDVTIVTEEGAAFKEVPLISTKVLDEVPVQQDIGTMPRKKNSLSKNVQNLYKEGYSVEEIASKLSCSITEVQFIIDMNN